MELCKYSLSDFSIPFCDSSLPSARLYADKNFRWGLVDIMEMGVALVVLRSVFVGCCYGLRQSALHIHGCHSSDTLSEKIRPQSLRTRNGRAG
jgi:hypothetical protein